MTDEALKSMILELAEILKKDHVKIGDTLVSRENALDDFITKYSNE